MHQNLPLANPGRDQRLDFWRGLCLIDMIIVHLVQQGMRFGPLGHEMIMDYTRFAAGGYVLISGLTVGFVFFRRVVDPNRRRESYLRLYRRAAFIFGLHVLITLLENLILGPLRGDPFPSVGHTFRDIVLFREGYDLLPFYVFMLALSPLVMDLMRRRLTWVVVLASAGLFIGTHHNQNYAWLSFKITNTFFFGLWQAIFLIGLIVGAKLKAYDAWPTRAKLAVCGGFWLASGVIFFAAFGHHFGLQQYGLGQQVMDARPLSPLTFWKTPLTVGELLRYLALVGAIVTTTDLLWRHLDGGRIAAIVNRMGQRSLAIYIAQAYLIYHIDRAADRIGGPWGVQFLWMAYAVALMWSIAWLLDVLRAFRQRLASHDTPLSVPS